MTVNPVFQNSTVNTQLSEWIPQFQKPIMDNQSLQEMENYYFKELERFGPLTYVIIRESMGNRYLYKDESGSNKTLRTYMDDYYNTDAELDEQRWICAHCRSIRIFK